MANALGRISGQLLKDDLTRNGHDLAFETDLLFLNVTHKWVGVNTDNPYRPLTVNGTLTTTNLSDLFNTTDIKLGNKITVSGDTILSTSDNINLTASNFVNADNIRTVNLDINNNIISSYTTDSKIEIRPDQTGVDPLLYGTVDIYNDLNITGNLFTPYDITLDGNIRFGSNDSDTVEFNADIINDIIPDLNEFYSLGSDPATVGNKRWLEVFPQLINGQTVSTGSLSSGGVNLGLTQGNIWYVSVNGDDLNTGDHAQAPFATIAAALTAAQSGDTVFVFPGTYTEITPLTVPVGVHLKGESLRSVSVVPDATTTYNNVFLLNGESTISNITVKDFFYDSINDTGYAFSFAPGFKVTSRSPYIQDISVLTKGSVTTLSDPLGFNAGDAGKGALVDGAVADTNSIEATMLFHSVTFITPGVNGLTMTNGVRVEWLNSFTYFANIGLYATAGVGRYDAIRSLTRYGAEVRSIGSANVYGNYGAWAEGQDTLMYLINHNFAYIGAGLDSTNDPTLNIADNETIELDTGKIYYQSLDNNGNFHVGDAFQVSFETGEASLSGFSVNAGGLTNITLSNGTTESRINATEVSTGQLQFSGNTITSTFGPINLLSVTNEFNIPHDVTATKNLNVDGDFNIDGTLTLGNQIIDLVEFAADIEFDLRPETNNTYKLGSSTNSWLSTNVVEVDIGTSLKISGHTIETLVSATNLELQPNGTGIVIAPSNNVLVSNDLTVNGTTYTKDVSITGLLDLTGDIVRTGDVLQTGVISQTGYSIFTSGEFYDISINNDTVTTLTSGNNLVLKAAGTGTIYVPEDNVTVTQNVTVNDTIQSGSVITHGTATANKFDNYDITIEDNIITTSVGNNDLELGASTGNIIYTAVSDVEIDHNLTVNTNTSLKNTTIGSEVVTTLYVQNVAGSDGAVGFFFLGSWAGHPETLFQFIQPGWTVVGHPTWVVTNVDESLQTVTITGGVFVSGSSYAFNGAVPADITHTGNYDQTGDTLHTGNKIIYGELQVDSNVYFTDIAFISNRLVTTTTDTNLELQAAGTGNVVLNDNSLFGQALAADTINTAGILNSLTITSNQFSDYDILIDDNFIRTTVSNNNLQLFPNGTGIVSVPNDPVLLSQDLEVVGSSSFKNTKFEAVLALNHTGTTTQTGNIEQTGDLEITNDLTVSGTNAFFTDIHIVNNVISTTINNNDLILKANGSGIINIADNASFGQQLRVNGTTYTDSINNSGTITSNKFDDHDITIEDNIITTSVGNNNLELRSNGTGGVFLEKLKFTSTTISTETSNNNIILSTPASSVILSTTTALTVPVGTSLNRPSPTQAELRFNTTDTAFKGFNTARVSFSGVYSDNRLTSVTVHPTNNVINFTTNSAVSMTLSSAGLISNLVTVDNNLTFNNDTISTAVTDSNIILSADGTGEVKFNELSIKGSTITNTNTSTPFVLQNTGAGYVQFGGASGIAIPTGDTASRPTNPEVGDFRYNSELSVGEIFNGIEYASIAGSGAELLNASQVQEVTSLMSLVFG